MESQDNEILKIITEQTKTFLENYNVGKAPTTDFIAKKTGLDRSVISKKLNQLFKEKKLLKINTRPVIYLKLSRREYSNNVYATIDDFRNLCQTEI